MDAALLVPGLLVKLAYSTPYNLTGKPLYPPDAKCLLRRSAAERLAAVARELARKKLRLVAWDCARPLRAQKELWRAYAHPGSVADPMRGSLHARGVAIDLGLAAPDGTEVPLPTKFDAFGPDAAADAKLPAGPALRNRELLRKAMHAHGWRVNPREWWHFSRLYGWRWPIAQPGF